MNVDEQFTSSLCQFAFMKDLKNLDLSCIHFDTPDMLFQLLHQCPQLQRLSCCDVTFSHYPIPQSCLNNQDAVTSGLKTLRVQGSYMLLEYMVQHWNNVTPCLMALDVGVDYAMTNDSTLEKILDAVGLTLLDLRLLGTPLHISFTDHNFPSLNQLQSLTVQFCWNHTHKFVQYMVHALHHLTSPCLQELTIYILCISQMKDLDVEVWSELRLHLESPQCLSTLLHLTFRFDDVFTQQEVVDEGWHFFGHMFPLCAERGILHVEAGLFD